MTEEILDSAETGSATRNNSKTAPVLEVIFLILLVIGTIFKLSHWKGGDFITMIACMALALFYLPGFKIITRLQNKKYDVFTVVSGMLLSVTIIGIMFKWFLWRGAEFLTLTGYVTIVLGLAFVWLGRKHHISLASSKKAAVRLIVFGILAITLHNINVRSLFSFYFDQRAPENLVDAFEDNYLHPENEAYKERYLRLRKQHFDSINRIDYPEAFQNE